jgi:HK97 family phage prohead protease
MQNQSNQTTRTALVDAQIDALIAGGATPEAAILKACDAWGDQTAGTLLAEITKSLDPSYDAAFVISAAGKDRVGDTINPDVFKQIADAGGRLVALWQHKSDSPIGYWENFKAVGTRLLANIKFASTPLARISKQLIDDGVPLGASIGFRGTGEPNKFGGIQYNSIELLECSVVSVPANPLAVQIIKSFGISLTDLGLPEQTQVGVDPVLLSKSATAVARAESLSLKELKS